MPDGGDERISEEIRAESIDALFSKSERQRERVGGDVRYCAEKIKAGKEIIEKNAR